MTVDANIVSSVTRHSTHENLQIYAERSRKADRFSDVLIEAGNLRFPAHRLVLSCYSPFFERLFESPMREQNQGIVKLNEVDEDSVRILLDFMYTRSLTIEYKNVYDLLATAHFLQLVEVCEFCFEFLKTAITVNNWSAILSVSRLYENGLLLRELFEFICENFNAIAESQNFSELAFKELTSIIDKANITETSKYKALTNWIRHDQTNQKVDLLEVLLMVDLQKLSCDFLEDVVANDPLIQKNADCLNAVMSAITKKFKEMRQKESSTKVISLGGWQTGSKVVEVYSSFDTSKKIYPQLPHQMVFSVSLQMNKCIYNIGGSTNASHEVVTNKVYRLKENEPIWEEITPMNEERSCMGAAVFKDCLVVAGGVSSGFKRKQSSEIFLPALKKWLPISSQRHPRSGSEMIACADCLFALGGYDGARDLSSVERLIDVDKEWEEVQPMMSPRSLFAAVNCNEEIYVIGGQYVNDNGKAVTLKSVEKYIPSRDKWVSVCEMEVERCAHAACLLNNKIFVVGGQDKDNELVKQVDCYDPSAERWTTVSEIDEKLVRHSLIAL